MPISIADQLRAIADQLDGAAVAEPAKGEPAVPENWVRIRPPFPRNEKYRDYPDPRFVSNHAGVPVETITGYASSAQELWYSPHFNYKTQGGRLMMLGDRLNALLKQDGPAAYPRILDEMAFPVDYADPATYVPPAEPGSPDDPWISRPPPTTDVPIGNDG